jgi:hypothetical protein
MKRTNVVLDEKLLERARRALGEKTYSGAINKALEKVVRQEDFWEAYRKFEELAHGEGVFDPDYIKEKTRNSLQRPKKRISANEARAPKARGKRRGSR